MKYKAIINYAPNTNLAMLAIAKQGHLSMVEHAATFDNPPLTMAAFLVKIEDFETKINARASNAKADVLALKLAREDMLTTLNALGGYVNTVAKGDPTIVQNSGLPYYSTSRSPLPQPPGPPQNLRLSHGTGSGIIVLRFTINKAFPANEVQLNLGTPPLEAGWEPRGTFYSGRVTLTGLPVGVTVHVRARAVGRDNALSNWSTVVQITVV